MWKDNICAASKLKVENKDAAGAHSGGSDRGRGLIPYKKRVAECVRDDDAGHRRSRRNIRTNGASASSGNEHERTAAVSIQVAAGQNRDIENGSVNQVNGACLNVDRHERQRRVIRIDLVRPSGNWSHAVNGTTGRKGQVAANDGSRRRSDCSRPRFIAIGAGAASGAGRPAATRTG